MAIYLSSLAKYAFYFLFDNLSNEDILDNCCFHGTSSSPCSGKSLLSEQETWFIDHDQPDLVLKPCVWRFFATTHPVLRVRGRSFMQRLRKDPCRRYENDGDPIFEDRICALVASDSLRNASLALF